MIEKPSWRRWYWNLSLEDNKALMLCPLILLSLPGNVPIIWLGSVRPFGCRVAEKERKDSLGNGDKVQEQSGKCTVCSEAQELAGVAGVFGAWVTWERGGRRDDRGVG